MNIKETIKLGAGGEIMSAEIVTVKKVTAEEFTQVYLKDNDMFFSLSKAESNVLGICWQYSVYYSDEQMNCPGNKVSFDAQLRKITKERTGLSTGTIRNTLVSLVNKEMLIKDPEFRAIYYLNPKYFFKGRVSDRTKLISHTINYEIIN